MENILYAVLWLLVLGGLFGFLLAFLAKKLAVAEDGRKEEILANLPGANCGGCGYAGCAALADAILKGEAAPSACGSIEEEGNRAICALMGLKEEKIVRKVAQVMCSGGCRSKDKYTYEGILDCRIAARLAGGKKLCPNGCIGLGNCERVCEFDALKIVDGVAKVDWDHCRGCGACQKACPKQIIQMIPASSRFAVLCKSAEKGKDVMRACDVGCIGCKKCEKACAKGAVRVEGFCASINQELCDGCGACAEACPRGIIHSLKDFSPKKNIK